MGYLISETTREEREQIVKDSLGNIDASCDGCMAGFLHIVPYTGARGFFISLYMYLCMFLW